MGDDEKLIGDILEAAEQLSPAFIALAGSPIPMMIGTDLEAIARVIEKRSGIPAFGFSTNGMHSYLEGIRKAYGALAKRMVLEGTPKNATCSVNILGLTPLDFSVNGSVDSIKTRLKNAGFEVQSAWAMGDSLDSIRKAGGAHVNLVVSACGMEAAEVLQERFGIPYVVGVPMGDCFAETVLQALKDSAADGQNRVAYESAGDGEIVLIGEAVFSMSLAAALQAETGKRAKAICPLEAEEMLRNGAYCATDEDDLDPVLSGAAALIADPLYKPICPKETKFVSLPHEAFSGRIYRKEIPDLVASLAELRNRLDAE